MVLPVKMSEVDVVFHRSKAERVLQAIHHSGLMHIDGLSVGSGRSSSSDADAEETKVNPEHRAQRRKETFEQLQRGGDQNTPIGKRLHSLNIKMERFIEIAEMAKEAGPSALMAFISPPAPKEFQPDIRGPEELEAAAKAFLEEHEDDVDTLKNRIDSMSERITSWEAELAVLRDLPSSFDLGSMATPSSRTTMTLGETKDMPGLKKALGELRSGRSSKRSLGEVLDVARGKDKNSRIVVVVYHKDVAKEAEKVIKGRFFTPISLSSKSMEGTVSQATSRLQLEIKETRSERSEALGDLRQIMKAHKEEAETLCVELTDHVKRQQFLAGLGRTSKTLTISGWVEAREAERFKRLIEKAAEDSAHVYIKPTRRDDDEVPVLLRTNKLLAPFQGITVMYGVPKYSSIDPTFIIGPLFTLFFALMLGDAGYGLLMLAGSLFLWMVPGRTNKMMRSFGYMGTLMGAFTMVFGVMFGSFFGDMLPRLLYPSLGIGMETLYPAIELGPLLLPYDSLRQPLYLMIISLAIGLVTLNVSIMVGMAQDLLNKKWSSAVLDRFSLILLQVGGLPLLASSLLGLIELDMTVSIVLAVVALIGFVLIAVSKGSQWFLAPFDVTGFIGDWMSFLRLMALGLSTTGLALTINVVTQLLLSGAVSAMESGGVGLIIMAVVGLIALVILVAAHVLNTALQLLGSAIHSLRLQYIEFFGRFFEAGGELYEPFSSTHQREDGNK